MDAPEHGHCVSLHGSDDAALIREVGRYLIDGLESGGTVLAIATPAHRRGILDGLSATIDPARSIEEGTLVMLDAAETLDRFMVSGYPDPSRFDASVGHLMRGAVERAPHVRAFGEMVGVLWEARQYPAAIRLEQLWNRLRGALAFGLFCGYPIDVFGSSFEPGAMDALLSAHTHLISSQGPETFERAMRRAVDEVLGIRSTELEERRVAFSAKSSWPQLPAGEALILWVREKHPGRADEVLAQAKSYYEISA
jgi:hypothetical protein